MTDRNEAELASAVGVMVGIVASTKTTFSAGLFSNGELHLHLDGQSMVLPKTHTKSLCEYLKIVKEQ